VPERARTDGLVAAGDCVAQLRSAKGLVTSSGSTPGLVGRTSADPITLRTVTSESLDNSRIMSSLSGHCVSGTMPKASKAVAASRSWSTEPSHSSGGGIARQKLIRKPGGRGRTRHQSRRLGGVCSACRVF